MHPTQPFSWNRLVGVAARSLVVGVVAGVVGGGFLFFVFGFIGYSGAPFSWRAANGWRALLDPGLGKGLAVGATIALVLTGLIVIWTAFARRFDPKTARPWLASLASIVVVLSNLEWLRTVSGWDWAGLATVAGIALLVGAIVWLVTPWVLRDWRWRQT